MKKGFGGSGKALALLVAACCVLLFQMLACTESPMSFAPNGDLAFVTMDPYDKGETLMLRGSHAYRLMVLPKDGKEPKVLDESVDCMFSAPTFSPDGKRVAYLRIPLLTESDYAAMADMVERRQGGIMKIADVTPVPWPPNPLPPPPTTEPATQVGINMEDLVQPALEPYYKFFFSWATGPLAPVEVVQRGTEDGKLISVNQIELPVFDYEPRFEEGLPEALKMMYVLTRLRYDPRGDWIYICTGSSRPGGMVVAVQPPIGHQRTVCGPSATSVISPDGKMIAAMQSTGITFMGIDGLRSVTLRWPTQPFLGGMAWMDNETVALLGRDWRHHTVTFVKSDGTVLRAIDLPGVPSDEDTPTDELAVSPDGKVMVIVTPEETFFLDAAGKVVGSAKHKKRALAHPTFTPDGKEVAFKYMDVDDLVVGRTEAIVFFSPDGKEQRRIAIPALKAGTTRPVTVPTASAPTTRPAEH